MPETPAPKESLLDFDDEASPEELDNRVQQAQEQLLVLKRQQDTIEKQKRELEELSRRQGEFEQGKMEMVEKLTRSLVVLEREVFETQRRTEQFQGIETSFRGHLQILESLNPKTWSKTEVQKELSRALSCVDDARSEFSKCRSKFDTIEADAGSNVEFGEEIETEHDFVYWLKSGFAFTLPLVVLGVLALILLMLGRW